MQKIQDKKNLVGLAELKDELEKLGQDNAATLNTVNKCSVKSNEKYSYEVFAQIISGRRSAYQYFYFAHKNIYEVKKNMIEKETNHRAVKIIDIKQIPYSELINKVNMRKYFIAECKCGHSEDKEYYTIKLIPIVAEDRVAAVKIAFVTPHVLRGDDDAVLNVYEVSSEEYRKQLEIIRKDRYFTCRISPEENGDAIYRKNCGDKNTEIVNRKYDDASMPHIKVKRSGTKSFRTLRKAKEAVRALASEREIIENI